MSLAPDSAGQSTVPAPGPHVVAYVQRARITDWKRLMSPRAGVPFPFVYGSRDGDVFAHAVRPGALLWVFGASPDGRPPALVARLEVVGRADDPGGSGFGIPEPVLRAFRRRFDYIAVGHPTRSRFYGYNNAAAALLALTLKWVKIERTLSGEAPCPTGTCDWSGAFAAPLNRPALVVGDPEPLLALERAAARTVFISWKRGDNWRRRRSVRELAYALADAGLFAWLDVLAFPPSIALRSKVDPDADLIRGLLHYGYARCNALLALETRHYGGPGISGNWTEREWTGRFDDRDPARPPPLRAVYRFEPSLSAPRLLADRDLCIVDADWPDVARIVRDEMEARVAGQPAGGVL